MAYTALTKPVQGSGTLKSLVDGIIDNLTFFYNLLGGSGSGSSDSILNGSFENDSDEDGVPDSWTVTLYSGGSSEIDTGDQVHGEASYKFTSTGTGGGYIMTEGYTPCSVGVPVTIRFAMKSSVADVHNYVGLRWYDKNKAACATAEVMIYDDATTNPTSWTSFIRAAAPPAGACFYRFFLIGCYSDDATAGTTSFDAVEALSDGIVTPSASIAEATKTSATTDYADSGYLAFTLPTLSASSIVEITVVGQLRVTAGGTGYQRFRVGAYYSSGNSTTSATYGYASYQFVAYGLSGVQALYQQLYATTGDEVETVYGKVDAYAVSVRIIKP